MHSEKHSYQEAFTRNIGILTKAEQEKLRTTCVAIAGLGGMGGIDFLTLVRMGVGRFHIADFDTFSTANSNRQVGANSGTVGQSKIEVMAKMAREISPTIEIKLFPLGFLESNAEEFLSEADAVIDAIDFFCLSARELLYQKSRQMKKTVLFSAPLGFSTTFHVFTPQSMSFENYFDFSPRMDRFDKLLAFAVGLAPRALHTKYMNFDPEKLIQGIGSSIGSSCNLGSALVCTELINIVLKKKAAFATPNYIQLDAFLLKMVKGRLIFGNRGPIQKLKRWLAGRQYNKYRAAMLLIIK
ncbi:MAG: ThiF family adenylyltransferase [Bdellovibrio sp.]|nr:ThiF family adenylyltransferase [Bdellovibrio sp.]